MSCETLQVPPSLRVGRYVLIVFVTLLSALLLAESYDKLAMVTGFSAWVAAACMHSLLSIGVLAVLARRGRLGAELSFVSVAADAPYWLRARPWLTYVPTVVVLLGSALLVLLSRFWGEPSPRGYFASNLAWIIWIPVVEELVFRAGIGRVFRCWGGYFWGSWFSALCFALVHTSPTMSNIMAGHLGLPLGPFLMGLMAELMYGASGRLWPVIFFHAACNVTAALFAYGDDRWLQWLYFLYS